MEKKQMIKEYDYNKYEKIFNDFTNDNSHEIIKKLYKEICDYYNSKAKDNKLDITIERVFLEKNIGKYKSFISDLYIKMIIAMFAALLSCGVSFINSFNNILTKYFNFPSLIAVIVVLFIIYLVIIDFDKSNIKERELVYNICLKVLDDIEKNSNNKLNNNKIAKKIN